MVTGQGVLNERSCFLELKAFIVQVPLACHYKLNSQIIYMVLEKI